MDDPDNERPAKRRRQPAARLAGRRTWAAVEVALGRQIESARRRRHWTQKELGSRVGISQTRASLIERGKAAGAPPEIWFALAEALGVRLRFEFARDPLIEPADAGHLEIQEWMLELGRRTGRGRLFELATRPSNPALSVDVGLRDDQHRVLILEECWNTFDNIGASVRNTKRKLAEAEALAVAIGGDAGPYRVVACWVVRDSRRNRELLTRYPETFAATFTGSSRGWAKALTVPGVDPPAELGLVWCNPRRREVRAWRAAGGQPGDGQSQD